MKKCILSILCFASLGAAEFQHKITVTPTEKTTETGKKEYLAKFEISQNTDEGHFVIPIPNLVCIEGEKAELEVKSPDKMDVLVVSVLVPENNKEQAKASIYLTENKEVVLSVKNEKVKIDAAGTNVTNGTKRKPRSWADNRQLFAEEAAKKT